MRSHSLILLLIALTMSACASVPAGHPALPKADDLPTNPNGSWITLKSKSGAVQSGELLAVANDSTLYIQPDPVVNPVLVSADTLKSAHLVRFDPEASRISGLAFLGTISTISNGLFLIFTAPTWIIVGTGATASRSHEPHMSSPNHRLNELSAYARFPAGMPAGFTTTKPPVVATPTPATPPPIAPPEKVAVHGPPGKKIKHFALNVAPGVSFQENAQHTLEQSGFGLIMGADWEARAAFIATRFSVSHREVTAGTIDPEWQESGESFDLGVLFGLHGRVGKMHGSLGLGPATYGAKIADVFDFKFSLAYQAGLTVDVSRHVGLGGMFAYNQNEFRDFYVVALGLRFVVW